MAIPRLSETLSREDIQKELAINIQAILGYVARWVEQGIGCSRVPNTDGLGLVEDRAAWRIASQHIANGLYHGIGFEEDVKAILIDMAKVVDQQYQHDSAYQPMPENLTKSRAFQAANDLTFGAGNNPMDIPSLCYMLIGGSTRGSNVSSRHSLKKDEPYRNIK